MNIALRIQEQARLLPLKRSVVFGKTSYTFKEFEERSNQMAHYLEAQGITKGTRTLLFVKPCLDFSVITFALFKVGAIPVLIDPGMGMKNLLSSIRQVRPQAMIAIDIVHLVKKLRRGPFVTVRVSLNPAKMDLRPYPKNFKIESVSPEETSAILFTSGGTGIPKGVVYTHGIFNAQTDALQKMFKLDETQIDLPGFPLFALFTLAMGMTSVIPEMDPTRPAACDPRKIVKNILEHQVTFIAGSPAIWERVGKYCLANNIQLGSVKQVVMFGAPVRTEIHRMFRKILLNGDTYTPYGATECLPVSLISGRELLDGPAARTLEGFGTCIGRPVPGIEIKIIKTTDIPETVLHELPPGEVGEIVVSGAQVTPSYFEMEEETKKAKILVSGKLWHRMGDLGRIDEDGRLWFLGRKSHRVGNLYPIQVEAIFNQHPEVKRSALIAGPAIVLERHDGKTRATDSFVREISELSKRTQASSEMRGLHLHPAFPVDVRHNIKIDRLRLSALYRKRKAIKLQASI